MLFAARSPALSGSGTLSLRRCRASYGASRRPIVVFAIAAPSKSPATPSQPSERAGFGNEAQSAASTSGQAPAGDELVNLGLSFFWPTNLQLKFCKVTEMVVGRMAMISFAASLLGEVMTGQGPLDLLGMRTNVSSLLEVDGPVFFLAAFNLSIATVGLLFDEHKESFLERRLKLAFNHDNELFIGHLAQLGLGVSLLGEALTGKGALAQFEIETGVPLQESEPVLLFLIGLAISSGLTDLIKTWRYREERMAKIRARARP